MKYFEKVATPSIARVLKAVQKRIISTAPNLSPKLEELVKYHSIKGGSGPVKSLNEALVSPAVWSNDASRGQKAVDFFNAPMSQAISTEVAKPVVSAVQKLFPNMNRVHPEVKKYIQGAESTVDGLITKGYEGFGAAQNPGTNPNLAEAIQEIMASVPKNLNS